MTTLLNVIQISTRKGMQKIKKPSTIIENCKTWYRTKYDYYRDLFMLLQISIYAYIIIHGLILWNLLFSFFT